VKPSEFVAERVAAIDPLGADEVCSRLPLMNARCDVHAIARALSALLPSGPVLSGFSYDQGLAATRDIGMFLTSLKRHGVEPLEAVPGIESVLVELGRRTDMIPRDTIHHYTEMNPSDARQRMFTGDAKETNAIESVRVALRRYGAAIDLGERLCGADPHGPGFPVLLNGLAGELGAFETAMDLAHEKLPPPFFYDELLPYFSGEIKIGGIAYIGPTAAHIPLSVIDMLVWESDHGSAALADYRLWALPYTMPRWRALHARWATIPSLTTRVRAAMADPAPAGTGPTDTVLRESVAALAAVLRALLVFRGKHAAYARKGSSAEALALLRDIIDQTRRVAAIAHTPADT
jgi:hypothetical protein